MSFMKLFRKLFFATTIIIVATSAHSAGVSGQGTWETTLQARDLDGNGLTDAFYDTSLNITWLANANVNGAMSWDTANTWANSLTIGGIGGWRLPVVTNASLLVSCSYSGGNCGNNDNPNSSEMAHLNFITLGNTSSLSNSGNFENFVNYDYWSGTNGGNPNSAWVMLFRIGHQRYQYKTYQLYALAVHDGDVAPVPEPETYAMLLAGLGLIGAVKRRRLFGNQKRLQSV